jgi:hypothetical protein
VVAVLKASAGRPPAKGSDEGDISDRWIAVRSSPVRNSLKVGACESEAQFLIL